MVLSILWEYEIWREEVPANGVSKCLVQKRSNVGGLDGERGRNRTYNLLIKSQLLCQLSYAPTVGILAGRTNGNYSIRPELAAAEK